MDKNKEELLAKYEEEIKVLEEKIYNCKNPDTIIIPSNVNIKERDKFYKEMHKLSLNKIISYFAQVSNLSIKHDFGEMKEHRINQRIKKLENIHEYYKNKIFNLNK